MCRAVPVAVSCALDGSTRTLDTLGRVTLGMTTTFNADGASFLGALVSPPGWYWYLPSPPPSSQGLLLGAWETDRSEEALVGDRAADVSDVRHQVPRPRDAWARGLLQKCHPATPKMPLMMARRTCGWKLARARSGVDVASASGDAVWPWSCSPRGLWAAIAASTRLLSSKQAGPEVCDVRRAQDRAWLRP